MTGDNDNPSPALQAGLRGVEGMDLPPTRYDLYVNGAMAAFAGQVWPEDAEAQQLVVRRIRHMAITVMAGEP